MWPKRSASVFIDSATYLLTISSPDIINVAMSLYDIIVNHLSKEIKCIRDSLRISKLPFLASCCALRETGQHMSVHTEN